MARGGRRHEAEVPTRRRDRGPARFGMEVPPASRRCGSGMEALPRRVIDGCGGTGARRARSRVRLRGRGTARGGSRVSVVPPPTVSPSPAVLARRARLTRGRDRPTGRSSPVASDAHEAQLEGVHEKREAVRDAELREDRREMIPDGLRRDVEPARDLAVLHPCAEPRDDLSLTCGEGVVRASSPPRSSDSPSPRGDAARTRAPPRAPCESPSGRSRPACPS
jgi:hypothetical protein